MYTKLRREFGRHCAFSDEPAEVRIIFFAPFCASNQYLNRCVAQVLADIRPDDTLLEEYIDRNPCTTNVQVAPEYSEHEARHVLRKNSRQHAAVRRRRLTHSSLTAGEYAADIA